MYHSPSTQPLPEEQSPTEDETEKIDKFGYLIANNCWHEIPVGETKIGRDATLCSIVLDDDTVSKVHAVVESEGAEDTFIYDAGSLNKTKIGKTKLRPQCRYKINDNDVITLGGMNVKFKVIGCKITDSSALKTSQLFSNDESSLLSGNRNPESPAVDKMKSGSLKKAQEVFKSPSVSVFMAQMKQMKKYYYLPAGEDSPVIDIFNQSTQCEVTHPKSENNSLRSESSPLKCISDDDIYNLSTQCEYAGDFLKPKDKILERLTMNGTASPKLNKSTERIDCDFNESGTFDFVKRSKFRSCPKSYINGSFNDDIFELATQCQTKLNNSVGENGDELNFKNKINQPENIGKSVKINLTSNSLDHGKDLYVKPVQEEETNVISLSDGEDEELCRLMKVNSPLVNGNNNSPNVLENNLINVELFDQSSGIFDIATQVPPELTKKLHGITINDRSNERCSSNRSKTNFDLVNNHLESHDIKKTEMEIKKPGETSASNTVKSLPDPHEDMILTQVFSSEHHNTETKSVDQCIVTEGKSGVECGDGGIENGESRKRSDNLQDFTDTQPFEENSHTAFLVKQNGHNMLHCSQDDIATQVFQPKSGERSHSEDGGKPNEENQVLSVIIEEAPAKPVPDLVVLCDSGDETESDLEIKLCLDSSIKKEEKKVVDRVLKDVEGSSHERQNGHSRPSTSSSDKTVSDLDIVELEEVSASILERNNCEDFIATQIFPSNSKNPKTNLLNEKNHLDIEANLKKARNRICEDFISTQIFPVVPGKKSPAEISDRTESDNDTRPGSEFKISEVSSEQDNCDIEDNSNESESLIKEIEDFDSSSPVMCTVTRRLSTPNLEDKNGNHESLTLTPSHPAFEAFSEIDLLIGKTNDKSDSGIGPENIFDGDVPEKGKETSLPDVKAVSDSDETDCEEELEAMNTKLGRQETFVVSKPKPETGSTSKITTLITVRSEDARPSTSNQGSHIKTGLDKSVRKLQQSRSVSKKAKKPENVIKSYFPLKLDEAIDSPQKRTLLMNSDEGIPKKRVKSGETRKKKEHEGVQTDDVILTQSLKLRNRVIRRRKTPDSSVFKKKTASETKTPGRTGQTTEIETVSRVRISKGKTSVIRKLVDDFHVLQEDNEKKCLKGRKSNGDDWKGIDPTAVKIVFTGFESSSHDRVIQKLGGEKVNHLDDGHILVTDRVRRTVKFLSAVALGLPIVSPKWLMASEKEMKFLNPWSFFLDDKPSEERWGFNLKSSVEKWRNQKLLKGYTVYATESTRPPVHEMLSIVRHCGGYPVTSCPDIWPEKSIVLTCVDDKKSWPPFIYRQVKIVHYEFLLSGVLRHFMDFKTYKLR